MTLEQAEKIEQAMGKLARVRLAIASSENQIERLQEEIEKFKSYLASDRAKANSLEQLIYQA